MKNIRIKIECASLMSGVVQKVRCVKLVSKLLGNFKNSQYYLIEDGVLFTMEAPANFSLSLVDNLTEAMRLFLDGYDTKEELHNMITRREKPIRII